MKKLSATAAIGFLLIFGCKIAYSQDGIGKSFIQPYPMGITYSKTTNLIFPYEIISVDRGSKDVLVQQAKGAENILHVKAGKEDFEETNLTVVTADGHLYSYILNYTARPTQLNIQYFPSKADPVEAIFSKGITNKAAMQAAAEIIIATKKNLAIRDKKHGIKLRLEGLFVRKDVLYFKIAIRNATNINYDVDQLRFFVTDQKRSRRTASQELELRPLYAYKATTSIIGQTEYVTVYALPKFTIPDEKLLMIQLMEKDGGRHLELKVPNRVIVGARAITEQQ